MNIMHLSRAEYQTLSTTGTLTKSGVTYTFDPLNNEYVVPDKTYMHIMTGSVGEDGFYFTGTIKVIDKNPTPYLFNTYEHQNQATITNDILEKAVLVGGEAYDQGTKVYSGAFNILQNGRVEFINNNQYVSAVVNFLSWENTSMNDRVVELY